MVKEWQDAHWISSRYDEMGERIETTSSFGANILTRRNEMGQAAQVIAYMDKERPYLKVPFSKNSKIYNDLTPQEALRKIRELQEAQKAQKASVKVNY